MALDGMWNLGMCIVTCRFLQSVRRRSAMRKGTGKGGDHAGCEGAFVVCDRNR